MERVIKTGSLFRRSTSSGGTYTAVTSLTGSPTNYTDSTCAASMTYYYKIYAYGPGANSPTAGPASATTAAGPSAASNLAATANINASANYPSGLAGQFFHRRWIPGATFQHQFKQRIFHCHDDGNERDNLQRRDHVSRRRLLVSHRRCPGSQQRLASSAVKVALPQVANVSPTEGSSFSGTVALFTDSSGSAGDYTASIDWGDGGSSAGSIARDPGDSTRFLISGTHTYIDDGQYTATITLVHTADSVQSYTVDVANVADAALHATAATVADPLACSSAELLQHLRTITQTERSPITTRPSTGRMDVVHGPRGADPYGRWIPGHRHAYVGIGWFKQLHSRHKRSRRINNVTADHHAHRDVWSSCTPGVVRDADYTTPSSKVDLSWYNAVGTQTGVRIEHSTDGGATFSLLTTVGGWSRHAPTRPYRPAQLTTTEFSPTTRRPIPPMMDRFPSSRPPQIQLPPDGPADHRRHLRSTRPISFPQHRGVAGAVHRSKQLCLERHEERQPLRQRARHQLRLHARPHGQLCRDRHAA